MLRAIRRPSATARGSRENWSLSRTMSAIALGDLAARAHRHRQPGPLQRRHVVDAVADHRRVAPALGERRDQRLLLLGPDPAEDRVRLGHLGQRGAVARQLVARRSPRPRSGTPTAAATAVTVSGASPEISFRSICCSRMNSIVSAASGRSVSSSTISASGVISGAPRERGRRAARPTARPKATTRRPLAVCSSSSCCSGRGQLQRAAGGQHVGRAEHVGLAAALPSSVSPLHFHSEENGTSAVTFSAVRRDSCSAIASSVRLRSPGAGGEPRQRLRRPRSGSALGDLDRDQLQARRWSGSRSCPRRSCRRRPATRSPPSAGPGCRGCASRTAATASVTLISSTSPSGISVISPAVAVCAASWSGSLRADRAKIRTSGERQHQIRCSPSAPR